MKEASFFATRASAKLVCRAEARQAGASMERTDAIRQIRELSLELGGRVTGIHRLVPGLADQPTQDEIFKALYELTKNVEVVKKQLLKLERRDESSVL